MFKNMSPKMRVVTIVAIIVFIALIIFFVVRHQKNKKKALTAAPSENSSYEPTPAEGGEFRVVPQEDRPENIPEVKLEAEPQAPRPPKAPANGQQRRPQVTPKPHLNVTGATKGGALPPMDLSGVPEDSGFNGNMPLTVFDPVQPPEEFEAKQ